MTPTHRRHNPFHDYRNACIYHITLVCSERAQVLGRIVGNTLAEARCELTPLGVEISQCIIGIEVHGTRKGRKLQVIAKTVMPDHIHFILFVQERLSDCTLGDIIRGFKHSCNKALRIALAHQDKMEKEGAHFIAQPPYLHSHAMGENHDEQAPAASQPSAIPISTSACSATVSHPAANASAAIHHDARTSATSPAAASAAAFMHHDASASTTSPAADSAAAFMYHDASASAAASAAAGGISHRSSSMSEDVSRPSVPLSPFIARPKGYQQPPLPIRSPRMLAQHALFEADYDETILRRHGQLRAMINYVHNNSKHRWQKQHHPDRLIPIRGILIAGKLYDAIGNVTLLGLNRHQVWIRSRWDETTRRQYQIDCILKARHFHALISPFISPHEAAVRDVALREGHSVIILTDNGFTNFTQCPGNLYDYCVKGQVLILVPSELPHINNKSTITRQECVMLNERAAEIAEENKWMGVY